MDRVPTFGRLAPEHVLRGLRSLDPQAELVWIEKDRWMLGRVVSDYRVRTAGGRLKESTLKSIRSRSRKHGEPYITHTDRVRLRVAELRLSGFQYTAEYYVPLPDSAVVHDQRAMDWMHKNLTDAECDELFNEDQERERAASLADLNDTERHRAAYKYLFTVSHYLGRGATTLDKGPRPGWKRHTVPPTSPSPLN